MYHSRVVNYYCDYDQNKSSLFHFSCYSSVLQEELLAPAVKVIQLISFGRHCSQLTALTLFLICSETWRLVV